MMRVLVLCVVVAGVVGVAVGHVGTASADRPAKIEVCHNGKLVSSVPASVKACALMPCPKGQTPHGYTDTYEGHVIEISIFALPAHMAHGDPTKFKVAKDGETCVYSVTRCECEGKPKGEKEEAPPREEKAPAKE